MKILLLANHVDTGGITAYMLNLVKALHKKNGVEFLVASRGGATEEKFKELGVEHILLPLTTKCEVSPKVFLSALRLKALIKKEGIDVIHANTRVTQVLAALLSRATGIPFISTCHGYFKRRLTRRLFPCWGLKVIAISDQVLKHLIHDFHLETRCIALVYNGIDLEKFRPFEKKVIDEKKERLGLDENKKIIGHIGRLSSVKGQKFLIQAASLLARRRKDVQFLIIGDGDEKDNLLNLIVADEVLKDIVFLKPTVKDTSLVLAVMDVFVMPSLQEGLGLSILEAQAQGIPVVASRVGGIPTVIEDGVTGLLCEPAEAHALAEKIEKLLDDPSLRASLVEKGFKRLKEKFSLGLMAEKTKKIYEEVR